MLQLAQAWAVLLETGVHANYQPCMVVAADTAALRRYALCQQPLAYMTCISTAGAFVTLAYSTLADACELSMTDTPLTQQPLCMLAMSTSS